MPDLFPAFEMPVLVEETRPSGPEYPESWLYDFEANDFVVDGAGRVVMADGWTAWTQWCIIAVRTPRFAYLAYSTDYGSELEQAKRQPIRAAVCSEVERTITETLLVDPRTQAVTDFEFMWRGDELLVRFTVVPVIGDSKRLEVFI